MSTGRIPIRGETLKWAIGWAGLPEEVLARKLRLEAEKLKAWIAGQAAPTWNQLENLAKHLNIPVPTFFGPPPPIQMPLPDFRRGLHAGKSPSPDLLSLIYDALRKQDWWKEQARPGQNPLTGAIAREQQPVVAGARLRSLIGLDDLQRRAQTWNDFRLRLVDRLEEMGVLVLRRGHIRDATTRTIDPKEAAGFAIPDPAAPVIYVNTRTFVNAQIFTLVHEAAHLAMGRPALDDELETSLLPNEDTERYCDSVAAEALVPQERFLPAWQGDPEPLAKQFRVSVWVVLRRALDLGLIRRGQYDRMLASYLRQLASSKKEEAGGTIAKNIEAWNGRRFTHAVIERLRDGEVTYTEAASLLWVSTRSLIAYLRSGQ
jgi:Zn-dependent peptidase ImmA (M78 family)